MKLPTDPALPQSGDVKSLTQRLYDLFRQTFQQVNGLSGGFFYAYQNIGSQPPMTGAKGDFWLNSNPVEAGAAGSKYILHGWRCTTSAFGATPAVWREIRCMTGN